LLDLFTESMGVDFFKMRRGVIMSRNQKLINLFAALKSLLVFLLMVGCDVTVTVKSDSLFEDIPSDELVTNTEPYKLVFVTQPPSVAETGTLFTSHPVVHIQNQLGQLLLGATNDVTLTAHDNPNCDGSPLVGLNVSGGNTKKAVAGTVIFTGV